MYIRMVRAPHGSIGALGGGLRLSDPLLADPSEFALQLGRNGREHVKENFLMTANVRRWLLLFRILSGI